MSDIQNNTVHVNSGDAGGGSVEATRSSRLQEAANKYFKTKKFDFL